MPNGFFLNDLIWFGDGASKRTAVSRGFMVEPGEINAFSVAQLNELHERLRILLGILGEEYTLQIQWSIDSDYRHELEQYHGNTLELRRNDPFIQFERIEFRMVPTRFWLVTLQHSDTGKAFYAVILPDGAIVEPVVKESS
jgi:hypothetical protein